MFRKLSFIFLLFFSCNRDFDESFIINNPELSLRGLRLTPYDKAPLIDDFMGSSSWCATLGSGNELTLRDGGLHFSLGWEQIDHDTIDVEWIGEIDIFISNDGFWYIQKGPQIYKMTEC